MTPDRPLLGIALMLAFCVVAPAADSVAKYIGDAVPLLILLLTRFGVQAVLLLPVALAGPGLRMPPEYLRLTFLRTLLHIVGIGAMFLSLRFLPLADAVAIAFVMPFILLLLGRVFLGEEVGPRRLGACVVGFLGTLLVIQPSLAVVGPPALLPLLVALVFALFMLVTRQMAKATDPVAMQVISGGMACGLLLPALGVAAAMGWVGWPEALAAPSMLGLLALLGVLGTLGHLLMAWSLRYAPASTLAPMQYLEIPFAAAFGWLVFRDFPNGLALLGIAVTVAAGLYVIARERRLSRSAEA